MSIDKIKKKSKLSLDEMHDNQYVGNPAIQKNDQQNRKLDKKRFETDYRSLNKTDKNSGNKYTNKMTFWMTEEIYDAFNEIHAKRIISKKKVDKGALFCEMVQAFIDREEENSN